jgi:hypothetical protein
MGEIPAIPDKGTGAVLTRNNQAIRGPTATRLNYFAARCPAGGSALSASIACPACGTVNAATNTFCVNCGTRLGSGGPAAPVVSPAGPPPASPPASPSPYVPYPAPYPYYGPVPRRATFGDMPFGLFDVWTKNFLPFFVVYLALGAATGALGAVVSYAIFGSVSVGGGFFGVPTTTLPTVNFGLVVLSLIATLAISVILTSIVTGAMTEYAVRRYRGEPMTVEQAFRRGLQRFLSILGANLLLTLLIFGLITLPFLLIILAFVAGVSGAGSAVALLCGGLILLVVLGVLALFLYISLVLYAPAIMMENESAVGGLSRSWQMTKGHRWSLLGAIVVTFILVLVISGAISFPLGLVGSAGGPIVASFVSVVSSALVSAFVGSWIVILVAVAYDLLVRQPTPYFGAPPYMPGPAVAPPPGAAQVRPPPSSGPPPSGPPPGP